MSGSGEMRLRDIVSAVIYYPFSVFSFSWVLFPIFAIPPPQGDFTRASQNFQTCLEVLGRPLPVSQLDLLCGVLWAGLRLGLQRLWVGRWLAGKAGSLWPDPPSQSHGRASRANAALVYHGLHQLHVMGMEGLC